MKHMKVLYHIGREIGSETIMKKGVINENSRPLLLEGETAIMLDDIRQVELYKLNGIGTMIKLQNGSDILFLTVPRLYFDVGNGFVLINSFATKRLKGLLDTLKNPAAKA